MLSNPFHKASLLGVCLALLVLLFTATDVFPPLRCGLSDPEVDQEFTIPENPFSVDSNCRFERIETHVIACGPPPAGFGELVAPPPPPPPSHPRNEAEQIFKVVEHMPMFPGCEDLQKYADRKACADKRMLEFIYSRIKYPRQARESSCAGTAVVSFVVGRDGILEDIRVVRDPGCGMGEEAKRVVTLMSREVRWTPGSSFGRPVKVQFNLPVKFRLE